MDDERKGPKRQSPLDGLTPADFVRGNRWPTGMPVEPKALAQTGLTAQQRRAHVRAVRFLRDLALDYERHVGVEKLTHEAIANRLGIGQNAIRDLREGRRWPSFRTLSVLRANIPTNDEMDVEYGTGQHPGS
ncbi:helix-turn-helix transcriptional regulator [Pedococcus bigeumensis]|uniref:helix-turn-helix transcriptional regulator n=1 Tax=Pedococcus bigeumensis TaxID=433644 RepID=UPI002FEBCB7A